jgi:hypothetical protein
MQNWFDDSCFENPNEAKLDRRDTKGLYEVLDCY